MHNNKIADLATRKPHEGVIAQAEVNRAIAEAQAALAIAQKFPRDERTAIDRILQAFTRPALAEKAMYTYARGGNDVTGPSIRAAEVLAQNWGHIDMGVRELEQRIGHSGVPESVMEAYAWDMQTNTKDKKVFSVPHVRDTRQGAKLLTDARDIYEHTANQGVRRKRACILAVIPGDVIDSAMRQAEMTLNTKTQITPDVIKSLIDKFKEMGVSRAMLEGYIQRSVDAITPALVVRLGKVYNSIKDGMSVAADWFELKIEEEKPPATDSRVEALGDLLKAQAGKSKQKQQTMPLVELPPAGEPISG